MLAVTANSFSEEDPLSGLVVGERPEPEPRPGWVPITVKAVTLNHHDLWSLRGVGLRTEQLPRILGCDGAGIDPDGNEVIIYPVVTSPDWIGNEMNDPARTTFSEAIDGTLAEQVLVPTRNLVPKPAGMSWAAAANMAVAWLTSYRMLFTQAQLQPGDVVLVQGAGGGVNSAVIQLGVAAGLRVWVTSRDAGRRERALQLGAEQVFESGARLPEQVPAVIDNVGAATWTHSINVLRPGGTLITCGSTTGDSPEKMGLRKIFFRELRIQGSSSGTMQEMRSLVKMIEATGLEPIIDTELPLARAREGFERLERGDVFGKIVLTC